MVRTTDRRMAPEAMRVTHSVQRQVTFDSPMKPPTTGPDVVKMLAIVWEEIA